ncbi:hypothetical protein ACFV9D_27050 [Streptomyces sp. NPDC059875]|uniref:hypothetical protein n=1 Tax=unclassified Streptomyces TaxID=2593676 RepID=UPI00364C2000
MSTHRASPGEPWQRRAARAAYGRRPVRTSVLVPALPYMQLMDRHHLAVGPAARTNDVVGY